MRGGLPPLDFDTVREHAIEANLGVSLFYVASLASIVGFKRLADRPQDRNDLIGRDSRRAAGRLDPRTPHTTVNTSGEFAAAVSQAAGYQMAIERG